MPGCCLIWHENPSNTFHILTEKTSSDITCESCYCLCMPIAFRSHRALRQIGSFTNNSGQVRAQRRTKKSLLLLKQKITLCSSEEWLIGLGFRAACQPTQAMPGVICSLPDSFISWQRFGKLHRNNLKKKPIYTYMRKCLTLWAADQKIMTSNPKLSWRERSVRLRSVSSSLRCKPA